MTESDPRPLALDPDFLGPLDERPVVPTGGHTLFPGEERFMRPAQARKRRAMVDAIAPTLGRLLEPGETLLWIADGREPLTLSGWIGLGLMYRRYHRVALALTDRRAIDVLLDPSGKHPATRVRSFGWSGVESLRLRMGTLELLDRSAGRVRWNALPRFDRKLLALLVPRIEERLLRRGEAETVGDSCRWHCPGCGAAIPPKASSCASCETGFRTAGVASLLALAFPGAGLYYARQPGLGTFDLLGELFLFAVITAGLLSSMSLGETLGLVVVGLLLFALTKAESVHLSRILVARSIPIGSREGKRWKTFGLAGGAASGLAIAAAIGMSGAVPPPIPPDLDFSASPGWTGTFDPRGFVFGSEENKRAEWSDEDGFRVAVYRFENGAEGLGSFRNEWAAVLRREAREIRWIDDTIPGNLPGLRSCWALPDEGDGDWDRLDYWLWHEESRSLHQVVALAEHELSDDARRRMDGLVTGAAWREADVP